MLFHISNDSQLQVSWQHCFIRAIWQIAYVAIGLKAPTEAKICLNPATTLYMYAQGWNVQGLYMHVDVILDGNCLFRAPFCSTVWP